MYSYLASEEVEVEDPSTTHFFVKYERFNSFVEK